LAKAQLLHEHSDFQALIAITAERIGATEGIVLKDYWVTAVLQALSSASGLTFLFKGGTSLSKGYGLIQRFSEDVDILILDQASKKPSQSGGVKLLKLAQDIAGAVNGITLDPKHPDGFSGKTPPKRVSILNYPHSENEAGGGILPYIKLEMSVHSGVFPNEVKPITSLVAQQIVTQAPDRVGEFANATPFNVNCLDPLRTFAEKLNAMAAAHRKEELIARVRHYYDLYYLLGSTIVSDRLDSDEYREIKQSIVSVDKELKQFDSEHDYNRPGLSEAFNPSSKLMSDLEKAYDESSIYYGDKPSFAAVMERIGKMRDKF
jgi:predicted nucleotidyltransferase component of viral defense system